MSYYWFNRKELLKKAHERYHKEGGKEKAARYYQDKKEITKKEKETSIECCQKKIKKGKEYSRNRYYKLKEQYKG